MQQKKKSDNNIFQYSKNESFENLEAVQKMALSKKNKDDEITPDISIFLKAEELKGKLCGLYSEKEKNSAQINIMGNVKINDNDLQLNVGEDINTEKNDDRIT